jgi:hypothetical protein
VTGEWYPPLWTAAEITAAMETGRNQGTFHLTRGLRTNYPMTADEAVGYMRAHVWPQINQEQNGHEFSEEEFEAVIRAVWRQYPGPASRTGSPWQCSLCTEVYFGPADFGGSFTAFSLPASGCPCPRW